MLNKVFSELFGSKTNCKTCIYQETPSYIFDGKPTGCLIAHIALSLIEAILIAKYYSKPIERLLSKCNVKNPWNLTLTAVLLHDFGKLTNSYRKGKPSKAPHNIVSSIIASKVVEGAAKPIISYAILFHHEAFHWKDVERLLGVISIHQTVPSKIKAEFNEKILYTFYENLSKLIKVIKLDFLNSVLYSAIEKAEELSGKPLLSKLEIVKLTPTNLALPAALALYKIIYICDNRAASARSEYWVYKAKKVNWTDFEDAPKQVVKNFTLKRYLIALSEIPNHIFRLEET
ncbi:MAG: hypothetical protein DRP00_01915 [Candidatus Aenigmatarchaeota archaeon]|nr:MAG: hypothetical protein DRP00_01915 [Candidatus Aenigmarchaeota archaeon]